MFKIAMESRVGNGVSTLFWSDRWLLGCSLVDLAPSVLAAVPSKVQQQRTVAQALQDLSWPRDIQAGLSFIGLFEFFQLWDLIHEVVLSQEEDQHIWKLDGSGCFSSKSAYRAFFNGINYL
jgi:hypothetical protein